MECLASDRAVCCFSGLLILGWFDHTQGHQLALSQAVHGSTEDVLAYLYGTILMLSGPRRHLGIHSDHLACRRVLGLHTCTRNDVAHQAPRVYLWYAVMHAHGRSMCWWNICTTARQPMDEFCKLCSI